MTSTSLQTGTLCDLPPGQTGRIIAVQGGRNLKRRCLALGLRVGSEVTAAQRRGQGIVVASGGSRIALGRGMAVKLLVEFAEPETRPEPEPETTGKEF